MEEIEWEFVEGSEPFEYSVETKKYIFEGIGLSYLFKDKNSDRTMTKTEQIKTTRIRRKDPSKYSPKVCFAQGKR